MYSEITVNKRKKIQKRSWDAWRAVANLSSGKLGVNVTERNYTLKGDGQKTQN
jgi:hypothetical protein